MSVLNFWVFELVMAMPTSSDSVRVRFGVFEADLRACELRKQGVRIKLHHQPFQVLTMLLERPGEVVTREELKSKLWPSETFVDFDLGLNSAVKKLREALGDSAEIPRYVETLPRRGYRFIAPLSDASTPKTEALSTASKRVIEEQPTGPSEGAGTAVPVVTRAHRWWMLWASAGLVGVLVLLVALDAGGWREKLLARATPVHIRSLAVLPLENLSGDPAQEYFSDGMTDALVTDLAQISSLRVISRTSTMRYKRTGKALPEIARELNVDGIVEGAVVRSGERVRVDAQLIDAATDRHFWARTYEQKVGDVIALQNEIARAIANEIQVQLTPQERARLATTQSVDPQAYESYLKGRYFWNKLTEPSIQKSIDYFQKAIQRDPNYALAYAGMAVAYRNRTDLPPNEAYPKSKAMARIAIQMDESLPEAHAALGVGLFLYDWDWAGAEKEFQRAIALNPNYGFAHQWYGDLQSAMGRPNFVAEIKRAHELDPLNLAIGGGGWLGSGQLEELRKRLEMDPEFPYTHMMLGGLYRGKGMYQEAIAEYQKAATLSGGNPQFLGGIGYTYAVWGKRVEARKTLQQLTMLSKRRYVSPYDIAMVYAGLGEKDRAFDWLQKALADRSTGLVFLKRNKAWDTMRSDPRYSELLRRVGLPQ
jgi:TolB-like protein/DNA-binding winged helix-turn-helix (wHTH) protein/Tfp pilus assembly protein PilF